RGSAHQVAYLPDGRALTAGDREVTIEASAPLALPAKLVGRLAIAQDGARVAMFGDDGVVRVIDLGSRQIRTLAGKLDATPRRPSAEPWTAISPPDVSYVRSIRDEHGWIDPVAMSRDGTLVAAAGTHGGKIVLWT